MKITEVSDRDLSNLGLIFRHLIEELQEKKDQKGSYNYFYRASILANACRDILDPLSARCCFSSEEDKEQYRASMQELIKFYEDNKPIEQEYITEPLDPVEKLLFEELNNFQSIYLHTPRDTFSYIQSKGTAEQIALEEEQNKIRDEVFDKELAGRNLWEISDEELERISKLAHERIDAYRNSHKA